MLTRESLIKKSKYNLKRNKELTKLFEARLKKQEYYDLCDYLKTIGMNKAEFVRWAFDKLMEENN